MAERIVLDPAEVATGRTEFDITPWVAPAGPDWDEGVVEAYRASGVYGDTVIDFRVPNRQVTIPLMVKAVGGTSFATVRSQLQQKAQLFQREGGWLKRVTAAGTFFADIQVSGLKFSGGWMQAVRDADTDAQIQLECSPDFYDAEQTLSDHVETSATEIRWTETSIGGNYPARVRLVVDEDQGQAQLGLMWCFRSRNYSSASTAALAYEAEALQPLDTATRVALTGASGGTVVTHGTLSTNWTPVLGTNIGGTSYMTHVGTYRMFARYRTTSGTAVSLRAVYDVGDLVYPVENTPWYHPADTAGTALYIADLGELRLNQAPTGTHRWQGMIQGRGLVGTENLSIDRVWLQCVDESAGLLRAPLTVADGLVTMSARSEFNTESGAITGDSLAVGGTWAGAGDTDDFSVTGGLATRTAVGDADVFTGRYITASTPTLTNSVAQVDTNSGASSSGVGISYHAVLLRYTDTSNWFAAFFQILAGATGYDIAIVKRVAGANTTIASSGSSGIYPYSSGVWKSIRLWADATGRWGAWVTNQGASFGAPLFTGFDPVLATGGALASGKVGIYDALPTGAITKTRTYDNFLAWVPVTDAVVNASQSAELRTDGMFREDVSGSAFGPVSWVEGDLPRLPVSGLEGRTVEGMVKLSRGDFATLPDTGIDDLSARVNYRRCWIQVPGT